MFETRKLIYRTTRIILPRQLTPICRFIYRICNFLANCCDYARKQYKADDGPYKQLLELGYTYVCWKYSKYWENVYRNDIIAKIREISGKTVISWKAAHFLIMAALCNRAGHYIFVLLFLLLLLPTCFCFPRLFLAVADWMYSILPHMVRPSANLECKSEMCCTRLAGNAGRKKSPKIRHLHTIAQLCRAYLRN